MWFSANRQWTYGYICSYLVNVHLAIFTAVVFNSGTRGQSSGTRRRESAPANEKAIQGELAYWHQAWRQREAVRGRSPNDRSLWTTARPYNSSSLSFLHKEPFSLFCLLLWPSVLKWSSKDHFNVILFPFSSHFTPLFPTFAPKAFPSSSLYFTQFMFRCLPPAVSLFLLNNWTIIHWSGVEFFLPPLAEVYCLRAVLELRSSDAARIVFNLPSIFIGPNYYTLLAIITFYYQFKTGQWFSHSGLLPTVSPLRLHYSLLGVETKKFSGQKTSAIS